MGHKKSRPGRGREAHASGFSYWKIPPGIKYQYAHCAGEPEWYECHEHTESEHGTKVCLHWFTDGELKCPRCRPFRATSTLAYVPLYRQTDARPMFVICHEEVADCLAGLKYGSFVYVGRVEEKSSIFVRFASDQEPFVSVLPERRRSCNLLPTLLNLWQYPQLDTWLLDRGLGRASAKEVAENPPQPGEQTLSVPAPTSDVEGLAIDAHRKDSVFGGTIDEVTNRMKKRMGEPSTNGKHTKPQEG